MDENRPSMFRSLWFWWFLMTAVYTFLNSAGYPGSDPSLLGHVAGFFGLFAPYGLMSLLLFMSPMSWLSLVIFITSMIYTERFLKKRNYSLITKIFLNLLVLMILTIIVDIVRQTPFFSWIIFMNGEMPRIV